MEQLTKQDLRGGTFEREMLERELAQVLSDVFRLTLDLPLDAVRFGALGPRTVDEMMLGAVITIKGSWDGEIRLIVDEDFAREICGRIYGASEGEPFPREQVEDVVRELINVIGGNIKNALPIPCALALPRSFSDQVPDPVVDTVVSCRAYSGSSSFAVEICRNGVFQGEGSGSKLCIKGLCEPGEPGDLA